MGKSEVRARAVGMMDAGKTQSEVAKVIGVSLSTVKCQWKRCVMEKSAANKPMSKGPRF